MKKKKDKSSKSLITGETLYQHIKKLRRNGFLNGRRDVVVFGQTPGQVTDVTVGYGGNLMLIYRALTSEEMGGCDDGPSTQIRVRRKKKP